MPSDNAKAVAMEVLERVRKGEKINKGEIIKKHGYGQSIAKHPHKVTDTLSYQSVILPFKEKLIKERERAINAMMIKDLDDVSYDRLSKVIDEFTKNIQLLGGKPTEIIDDFSQYPDEELIRKIHGGSGTSQEGIGKETS